MNKKGINKAIEISHALKGKNLSNGRCFHTTFVFKKSRIVSIGVNNYFKSHPKILEYPYLNKNGERYNTGIHSELSAILKLKMNDFSNLELLNLRLDKHDNLCYSKPCFGCSALLNQLNFKNIFFSNEKERIEKL